MIRIDNSAALSFLKEAPDYGAAWHALDSLLRGTGRGNDFVGWVDLPTCCDKDEFARIKACAERIRQNADILIVIGIGGSYLGASNPFSLYMLAI